MFKAEDRAVRMGQKELKIYYIVSKQTATADGYVWNVIKEKAGSYSFYYLYHNLIVLKHAFNKFKTISYIA